MRRSEEEEEEEFAMANKRLRSNKLAFCTSCSQPPYRLIFLTSYYIPFFEKVTKSNPIAPGTWSNQRDAIT
jgi:hypothetical protein